jgi:hypothetical protein
MDGGARLRPDGAAPPLFLLPSTLGGARELPSAASVPGTGVAFDSDDLSALSGGCIDGEASPLIVGAADTGSSDDCCGRNCDNVFLESLSVTIIEPARFFSPVLEVGFVEAMTDDFRVDDMGERWWSRGWCWWLWCWLGMG